MTGAMAMAAAVLVPIPAQSSPPQQPPAVPTFEGDVIPAPPGTPRTRMPRLVHEHGSTTYRTGLYDVHILVAATDDGPAPWDEAAARRGVQAMDAWSQANTEGLYRFRLAGFQVLPAYPGSLCGVGDALAHAEPEIEAMTPTAGATDVLPVVVARWPSTCGPLGQAYLGSPGAWVGVNPQVAGDDVHTLIHEVFHNLGLEHAAAVEPAGDLSQPWPAGLTPAVSGYGDASDVMGGRQWTCSATSCSVVVPGLGGHHRNVLGAMPPEAITHVPMATSGEATTVTLAGVANSAGGVRLAYLPWLNRSKLYLEYRPPVGADAGLDAQFSPRSGVYVRLVDTDLTSGPEPYPVDDDTTYFYGTVAIPVAQIPAQYWAIPLGFKPGGATLLPDGTRIEVLSADASVASVRVTRPIDDVPPTMSTPRIDYAGGSCTRYPCTVPSSAIRKGKYRIWLSYGVFDDNQWVQSARITVNGVESLVDNRAAPDGVDEETSLSPGSSYWGAWRSYRPGRYTIGYTYTDLAGNTGTSTYQVTLPKPKKKR